MPNAAKRPCTKPGCHRLVTGRAARCELHPYPKRNFNQENKWRGSPRERGYDRIWEKARKMYLAEHPICEECHRAVADTVHHVVPIVDAPELRLVEENFMGVCRGCHPIVEARSRKG